MVNQFCSRYDPETGAGRSCCRKNAIKTLMVEEGFLHLCHGCLGSAPAGAVEADQARGRGGGGGKQKQKQTTIQITSIPVYNKPNTIHVTREQQRLQVAINDRDESEDSDYDQNAHDDEDDDDDDDDDDFAEDGDMEPYQEAVIGQGDEAAVKVNEMVVNLGMTPLQGKEVQKKRKLKEGSREPLRKRVHKSARRPSVRLKSAFDRVLEFPMQSFRVINKKLICVACKGAEIDLKKDTITGHIKSQKHTSGLEQLAGKKDKKVQLILSAQSAQSHHLARGITSNISLDLTANRIRVLRALLTDGIPLNVLSREQGGVRELLEELLGSLPRQQVANLIPSQILEEVHKIEAMVNSADCLGCSVIFDGTPKAAEVFGVMVRFVCRGRVLHRLLALDNYKSSPSADDLQQMIFWALNGRQGEGRNGIDFKKVQVFICDGASVNKCALDALRGESGAGLKLFPFTANIVCISHAANIVGTALVKAAPRAMALAGAWMGVIANSMHARHLFKSSNFNPMHSSAKTTSETRWYSKYEVISQMAELSGAVWDVATSDEEFCSDSRATLRGLVEDEAQRAQVRLELCAIADIGATHIEHYTP